MSPTDLWTLVETWLVGWGDAFLGKQFATNGELMALSGFINPYPGRLGVVEEGALADLLLVEGDPLQDLGLVADPERSFLVIMKDGVVHKNTLPR